MARTYTHPRTYSEADKALLTRIYTGASQEELLAAFPTRSLSSIRCQAGDMKLHKNLVPPTVWTASMDAVLRAYYPKEGAMGIASRLKIPPKAVRRRAERLKVSYAPLGIAKESAAPIGLRSQMAVAPTAPIACPEPVKRSPFTPNLNANMEARRRREAESDKGDIVGRIRKLPADSEGRKVFLLAGRESGIAAKVAFLKWEASQQLKQAA